MTVDDLEETLSDAGIPSRVMAKTAQQLRSSGFNSRPRILSMSIADIADARLPSSAETPLALFVRRARKRPFGQEPGHPHNKASEEWGQDTQSTKNSEQAASFAADFAPPLVVADASKLRCAEVAVDAGAVLALWAAVVAYRAGRTWAESLTLGHALSPPGSRKGARASGRTSFELCGRRVPVAFAADGSLRGAAGGAPGAPLIPPGAALSRFKAAFGEMLPAAFTALLMVANAKGAAALRQEALTMYASFRPLPGRPWSLSLPLRLIEADPLLDGLE